MSNRRIQRAAPIGSEIGRVDKTSSGLVRGAREVVSAGPPRQRAFLRSAEMAGAATAAGFGAPVDEHTAYCGNDGVVK